MLGGLALGGGFGFLAGIIWSLLEAAEAEGDPYDVVIPAPTLTPTTTDTVNVDGKVVHPKGMRPPEVDAGRAVEWRSKDNLVEDGRRYDSTVDRATQILWPGEPQPDPVTPSDPNPNHKGYTGRWGPRVESDAETRRAGMRFPNFWFIFFDRLIRDNQPSRLQILTSGTSWTVPNDWNSVNNSISCIGGGGGGSIGEPGNLGAGGGGGAFSSISNLALTPGASVAYKVGVGGASEAPGGDTWFNGAGLAAASVGAKGGRAGTAANAPGLGGAADAGVGATKLGGGNGTPGVNASHSGGGGAGGPQGAGGNASAAVGGSGNNGAGGAGGGQIAGVGQDGGAGKEFGTAGSGGGGGGNTTVAGAGHAGGNYGGGGSGSRQSAVQGGQGADGVIIIRWTP